MHHLLENIITNLRIIRANKVRSALTVLGIVIGIASVIIIFSAGEGIENLIVGQVESFGTNIIESEIKVPKKGSGAQSDSESSAAMAQGVQVTTMTLDDMEDIDKLPNITRSYAAILGQSQASYGSELRKIYLYGVSSEFINIDKSEIDYGRFFTEAEDKSLAAVIVLGSNVKDRLFGDQDPIGKMVKLQKTKFKVIGVLKSRGSMAFMNFDDFSYVPVRTLQKKIMGIRHVLYMIHEVRDMARADETADEIRAILRENHDIADPEKDDFRVSTMQEMMDILGTITGAITLLLLSIVGISLVVGGVGVMNIMYVVVSERTMEIGLRKAVGAKSSNIIMQFLFESIFITLMGGAVGIVIGIGAAYLIYWGAKNYGLDWNFNVPLEAYITALGFSVVFGVLFGLYPARKAARLNPIEALRKE